MGKHIRSYKNNNPYKMKDIIRQNSTWFVIEEEKPKNWAEKNLRKTTVEMIH